VHGQQPSEPGDHRLRGAHPSDAQTVLDSEPTEITVSA
jgi:hypothetical protein